MLPHRSRCHYEGVHYLVVSLVQTLVHGCDAYISTSCPSRVLSVSWYFFGMQLLARKLQQLVAYV